MSKWRNILNENNILKNRFLRSIFLASLGVVTILPLFVIFYVLPSFTNLLVESTKNDAVRVAKHFASEFVSEKEELTAASFKKASLKEMRLEDTQTDLGSDRRRNKRRRNQRSL